LYLLFSINMLLILSSDFGSFCTVEKNARFDLFQGLRVICGRLIGTKARFYLSNLGFPYHHFSTSTPYTFL